ncbi:MAG: dipeptide epimerase [Candidatus Omnitrophica bacterium]|nr:dipeptide epimerase [Candidatus Omnitrophota bacterium]
MKLAVKDARCRVIRAPLSSPFRIATGQHDFLENVFLTVELNNGIKGFGEAAVATHITGETIPQTLSNLEDIARAFRGCDVSEPLALLGAMRLKLKGNHAALAAVEMAVLDALARYLRIPFWKLFGPKASVVATDITIVIGTLKEAEAGAKDFYKRGFRSFKIKVGRDIDLDFKRVLAVQRLAPKAAIILDANQSFTADAMLVFLRQLRAKGVATSLIEQPVPKKDIEGLSKVTRLARTLVCADESAGSILDVKKLIRKKAVTAVNIKFMKTGILESMEIASFARQNGLGLMMGAMMESSLAITAAAQFAAGLGCFQFIDLDTTFFIKGKMARSPYLDRRGVFSFSETSGGIGITV